MTRFEANATRAGLALLVLACLGGICGEAAADEIPAVDRLVWSHARVRASLQSAPGRDDVLHTRIELVNDDEQERPVLLCANAQVSGTDVPVETLWLDLDEASDGSCRFVCSSAAAPTRSSANVQLGCRAWQLSPGERVVHTATTSQLVAPLGDGQQGSVEIVSFDPMCELDVSCSEAFGDGVRDVHWRIESDAAKSRSTLLRFDVMALDGGEPGAPYRTPHTALFDASLLARAGGYRLSGSGNALGFWSDVELEAYADGIYSANNGGYNPSRTCDLCECDDTNPNNVDAVLGWRWKLATPGVLDPASTIHLAARSVGPDTCGETLFDQFTGFVGLLQMAWGPDGPVEPGVSYRPVYWRILVVMDRTAPSVVSASLTPDAGGLEATLVATDRTTRPAAATLFVRDAQHEPVAFAMEFADPTVARTGGDEEHFERVVTATELVDTGLDPDCLAEAWMATADEAGWLTESEHVTWTLASECLSGEDAEPGDTDMAELDDADIEDDDTAADTNEPEADTVAPDTERDTSVSNDEPVPSDPGCGCTQVRGGERESRLPWAGGGFVLLVLGLRGRRRRRQQG